MPIYEYVCQDCSQKYEKLVRARTAKVELKCPKCGSDRGEKAFSAFSTRNASMSGASVSSAPSCGPVG